MVKAGKRVAIYCRVSTKDKAKRLKISVSPLSSGPLMLVAR
jgi:hypothetical protein